MSSIARARLTEERKAWRKDHPFGFVARPRKNPSDGSTDLMVWDCIIPGSKGTVWEGASLKAEIKFSEDYPISPPAVIMKPVLWHLNVWSSGRVCLNILNPEDGTWHGKWQPTTTVKQILLGVQDVLANPHPAGARPDVEKLYKSNRAAYEKRLEEEANKFKNTL